MNTATRKQAERNYNAALAAQRASEDVSESAYADAALKLDIARRELCAAEQAFPTTKESARAANTLRLRNRGLDC